MKPAGVREIKKELSFKSETELRELCLQLARFKKDNKELLTYLLFEAHDEESYVAAVKTYMDDSFSEITTRNYYYIRKSCRKILTQVKKYIRYSKKKETEADLLIYYCKNLKDLTPSISRSQRLYGIYETQLRMAKKAIDKLHEDLQYDLLLEINELENA